MQTLMNPSVSKSLQQSPHLTAHLEVIEVAVSHTFLFSLSSNEWEMWSNLYTDLLNICVKTTKNSNHSHRNLWFCSCDSTWVYNCINVHGYQVHCTLHYLITSGLCSSFTLKDTKWRLSALCVLFKYKYQRQRESVSLCGLLRFVLDAKLI